MGADNNQADGLKQIAEWSRWLVTVETGAIALIGIYYKIGTPIDKTIFWLLSIAIFCLFISIISAALLIISIPAAFQDIKQFEKVLERQTTFPFFNFQLYKLVLVQFVFFVFGVLCLCIAVIETFSHNLSMPMAHPLCQALNLP
jgi:hypothetical protein